jgi:transposase-like protein
MLCADEIQTLQEYVGRLEQERCGSKDAIHGILRRERMSRALVCPKCGSIHFVKNGKTRQARQKYRCMDCQKSFSDTTDSITHSTKKSYRVWARYIECMDDGLTLEKTAQLCGISKTTAFAWRHKIMDSMGDCERDEVLSGEIQLDETYFLLNMKGFKKRGGKVMPRASKKRGTPAVKRGVSNEEACVLVALDEDDQLIAKIIGQGNPTIEAIDRGLNQQVRAGSTMVTDSKSAYQEVSKRKRCELHQIPSGFHTAGMHNLGSMNQLHSEMKNWFRRFRGVSTKHLSKYLHWFRFRKYQQFRIEFEHRRRTMFLFSIVNQNKYPIRGIHREPFPIDIKLPYVS